ncbi:hypothetical protein Drorol1_Dr00011191 [Drosera rotundifolia]
MELENGFEGLVTRVIDTKRKSDECWGFDVQKDQLGFGDRTVARGESKGMTMDWCEVERVDNVSMEMSGNGTISSGSNGVDDKGFGNGKVVRSKSKGRKLEWCEVERVTDVSLEMLGDGTISSGSNKVEDVVKGSPNSASVKCFGEGEDEEMCIGDSDMQDSAGLKRKRDCLLKMLQWMGNVAKDPRKPGIGLLPESYKWKSYGNEELWKQVLSARKGLFVKMSSLPNAEQAAWKKKHRMYPSMYDDHSPPTDRLRSSSRLLFDMSEYSPHQSSSSTSLSDTDRSYQASSDVQFNQRALRCDISFMKSICPDHHIRKRIPVGPYFQVDGPQWTGNSTYENDDKWLGTRIWPLEKRQNKHLIERDPIGKGRQDSCGCQDRGSITCVRFHVAEKRIKLKLELASAFYHWNFDKMGEEVTLSWTKEEEKKFRDIVKANPQSQNKCFWPEMIKALPAKIRRDLVSYYWNVFLLQRRGYQNRCNSGDIDSEDDETEFGGLFGKSCGTNSILGTPRKSHAKR